MIAAADTSPLCYLILVDETDLLRQQLSQIVVPSAVITKLRREDASEALRRRAANPPSWASAGENLAAGRGSISLAACRQAIDMSITLSSDLR